MVQCELEVHDHLLEIIEALRAEAVNQGFGPLESQKAFEENIAADHNPYKELHAERTAWVKDAFELKDTADVLLVGTIPGKEPEPVAWTNTYKKSRVFYTSLGHPDDFANPQFRRLLVNAISWTLDKIQ